MVTRSSYEEGANRQSDCVIGKAQVADAAEVSFFRSEKTGKVKSDPFGTTGAQDSAVNHDGNHRTRQDEIPA
jgi:hypothetical protein